MGLRTENIGAMVPEIEYRGIAQKEYQGQNIVRSTYMCDMVWGHNIDGGLPWKDTHPVL